MIGHFTQVISEKSKYMGCALIHYIKPKDGHHRYNMYFVCNYSFTNYMGEPVYSVGPTASKCQTGTDSIYNGLCSKEEYYDENISTGEASPNSIQEPMPSLSESSTTSKSTPQRSKGSNKSESSKTKSNSSSSSSTSSSTSHSKTVKSTSESSSPSSSKSTSSKSKSTTSNSSSARSTTKSTTKSTTESTTKSTAERTSEASKNSMSNSESSTTKSRHVHISTHISKSKKSSYVSFTDGSSISSDGVFSSDSKWSATYSELHPNHKHKNHIIASSMSIYNVSSYSIPPIPHIPHMSHIPNI